MQQLVPNENDGKMPMNPLKKRNKKTDMHATVKNQLPAKTMMASFVVVFR